MWLWEILICVEIFIVFQQLLGLLIDVDSRWQNQGVRTRVEARLSTEGVGLVIRKRLMLVGALPIALILHEVDINILDVVAILNTYHSFLV